MMYGHGWKGEEMATCGIVASPFTSRCSGSALHEVFMMSETGAEERWHVRYRV